MSKTIAPSETTNAPALKLPKNAKPSKALAKSLLRPNLTRAYVAQPNGHKELIASDSYILVRIPVADEIPEGAIAPQALKRIEKGERHTFTESGSVKFEDNDGTPIEYHAPEQMDLPYKGAMDLWDPKGARVVTLALNPELLKNLADAMGATTGVVIQVIVNDDDKAAPKAMHITPMPSAGLQGEGLLMPVRLNA